MGVVTTIGLNNVGKVQLTSKFLLPSVPVAVVRIMLAQAAQLLGSFLADIKLIQINPPFRSLIWTIRTEKTKTGPGVKIGLNLI